MTVTEPVPTIGPARNGDTAMTNDVYRIRVKGHLDPGWSSWFSGLAITREADGTTILCGAVADQACLLGLLEKAHDLNLTLVSVDRIDGAAPC